LVINASDLPAQAGAMVRALESSESSPGLAAQCWAALDTLGKVLKQNQLGFDRLVKTTVYLRDENDLRTYEAVRAEFIADNQLPAMEVVVVHGPGPTLDAHIQIEAIAIV
jgi:enamine deaminase RidA (YjgF/YER057c/UK114 family)